MELFHNFASVKKLFKYLLNSILAIIVLLMSVGVSYSTINCPKKENQKSCCTLEEITCCTVEIANNCCYEEKLEIQFDFDTPVEEVQEAPDFLAFFRTNLYTHYTCKKNQKITWAHNFSPPKKLSKQLSILQIYRL